MRVLIAGNSGSGKSWRARALAAEHGLAHLDLDTIVWVPGLIAVARPVDDALADLRAFCQAHEGLSTPRVTGVGREDRSSDRNGIAVPYRSSSGANRRTVSII